MNKGIKKVVYNILENDEYARENDIYLIMKVALEMTESRPSDTFVRVLSGLQVRGISFEAITRHRRKWIEKNPDKNPKKIAEKRQKEEENYIVEFGKEIC